MNSEFWNSYDRRSGFFPVKSGFYDGIEYEEETQVRL